MFEGVIAAKFANRYFEKDVFKIIKKHAALGALLMMLPDFGFGVVFFIAVLWSMYNKVSKKVGISFKENMSKLIGVGVVVNIIVALILDVMLTTFFFIEPFIVYFQFYLSGFFFVKALKRLY